jgi:hypothetical protein
MNHETIFDDIVSELKRSTSQVKQNEAELRIYIRDMIRMHVRFIAGDRDSIAHRLLFRCTLGRDIETWNASNRDILDIDSIVNDVDTFLFGESKKCPTWLPGLGTVVLLRKATELYYQHDVGRDTGYLQGLYQVLLAAMPYVNAEGLKGLEQRFTYAYPRDIIR